MPGNSADPPRRPEKWTAAALALLGLVFAWRSIATHRTFNETADEAVHIACGLEVWQNGRYTLEPQHPPLARAILALPPFLAGLRHQDRELVWSDREFYWRALSLARSANLVFLPFLLFCVYRWGRDLHGALAGVAAAALVSFSPSLLAHASLATLDFGAATTQFASAYYFWRWSREPTLRRLPAAAVTFGIATLTKFSALLFLPLLAGAFFLLARRERSAAQLRPRAALRLAVIFLAALAAVVWAGYGFEFGPLPPVEVAAPAGTAAERLQLAAHSLLGPRSVPAPRLLAGVLDVVGHNAQGHSCYLLGRLGQFGWWYYFPVALAVKTTLPLLVAAAIGLAVSRGLMATVAVVVILSAAMPGNINLGIRHVLVLYPFFGLLASGIFAAAERRRWLAATGLALASWHAVESAAAHPDYLAYFNQIARGREHRFLLDSNLDWGQDLERLRRYLERNRIGEIQLSYFGRIQPERLGLAGVRPLPADSPPAGWVAVSRAHIAGLALEKGTNLGWLEAHAPAARIGKSILVFHFPR